MSASHSLKSLLTLAAAALFLAPASLVAQSTWRPLGPNPSKDAAADDDIKNEESGRVLAIAIHPTNPKLVYVGTADGGLYVSRDGGQAWTSMNMPSPTGAVGQSQAIGAIAFAPADPTTLFIGTGQDIAANNTAFGVGVYIVKNADTAPAITGPFNLTGDGKDIFTGRSISAILVDPNDANTIFVSTGDGGAAGLGDTAAPEANRPMRGIYRSRNALSASPTFTQVTSGDSPVKAMVYEPGNSNTLIYAAIGLGDDDGGVFRTTNAADEKPTFTKSLALPFNKASRLAINKVGDAVTVLLATNEKQASADAEGTVRKSTDGGVTFGGPLAAANGFGGDNLVLEIDPTNADIFYLGGSTAASGKNIKVITETLNGGASFTPKGQVYTFGVHPDSQVIRVAPSDPSFVYVGGDGGMWKTTKGGKNWLTDQPKWEDLNNTTFSATQFNGIAQHPKLRNFIFGGAQDNGSPFMGPDMSWVEFVGGDGGVALIDSNATATSDVTIYHTFNQDAGKKIKFDRVTVPAALLTGSTQAIKDGATTVSFGAGEGATANGITVTDKVLFYNPMALGPGNPNTLYFATDRLYRSADQGVTMTVVSQAPLVQDVPASAVGISPQDDNVRIVGLKNGKVFATTTGDSTLRDVTISRNGQPISSYVSRTVIDPNNRTTAYVTFADYGLLGAGVWKTTNLDADAPTWTASGNGIPDVPVNAFAVDPRDSTKLYAGTDIGVYSSTDGGQTWAAFGTGLPRMQVFDMAVQADFGLLRIGTYGRGVWEIDAAPTANAPAVIANNGSNGAAARPRLGPGQHAGLPGDQIVFTISVAPGLTKTVSFNYTTVDGTAVAGADYTPQSGVITFVPGGPTQQTITVDVISDPNPDADETFYVDLSNPSDATLSTSRLTGTIVSANPLPTLSIDDPVVSEGGPGDATTATFTVSLSSALSQDVQFTYRTEDGTAQEGNDYLAASATATIPAGQMSTTLNVQVRGDLLAEEDETFAVRLSDVIGDATLAKAKGVATILNDDGPAPYVTFSNTQTIAIDDVSTAQSKITVHDLPLVTNKVTVRVNELTHTYPDDVNLLLVSPTGKKVALMTAAGGGLPVENVNLTFDDSAVTPVPNDDSFASGKFQPGLYGSTALPQVPTGVYAAQLSAFNGTDPNGDWTLYVVDASTGDTGMIAGGWSLTISASDGTLPALTIADTIVTEALSSTEQAKFPVRLAAPSSQTVTVDYTTDDGTGIFGTNYNGTSGTLTFAPGVVEQTISVGVPGSNAPGADLTFFVNLSNPTNAVLANNQAKGTIVDDNVIPQIRINDIDEPREIEEGEGAATAFLTVSLSAPSKQEVTVDFTTVDGDAMAGVDYEATSGTLVFAPGEVSQDIVVPVIVNDTEEANKHFTIQISNAVNGVIAKDEGDVVIVGSHAPSIKTQPFDRVMVEGDSVTFRVEASGDNLAYQWLFNDVVIPGATAAKFTISQVTLASVGEYSVLVRNSLGEELSDPATLDVIARLPLKRFSGYYQGLIQGATFQHATTGGLYLNISAGGSFTGGITLGGQRNAFRGRFDANGDATFIVGSGASVTTVHLHLDMTGAGGITGTVTKGGVTSNLFADNAATRVQPGNYTVLLPRNPAHPEATFPQGNGYGGIFISGNGAAHFVGRLGDGTIVAQGGRVSGDGYLTFYALLYNGAGSISGALEFRSVTGKSDLDGTLDWFRPELLTNAYPHGFQTEVDVIGSRYTVPAPGTSLLGFTQGNAEVRFPNGDILENSFTVDGNNRVTVPANSANHFTLQFYPTLGLFRGTISDGPNAPVRGFIGTLLPTGHLGGGEFFDGASLGSVDLSPSGP